MKTQKALPKESPNVLSVNIASWSFQKWRKPFARAKVFVDWSQNDDHKTTVCVYSLRAKDSPTVSTPVTWDEVESTLKKSDASRLVFTSDDVLKRVEKHGDLFAPLLKKKQRLKPPELMKARTSNEKKCFR